nr:zinc finger, CCHC-type [Tanacetum cinerariifolium]
MFTRHENKGMYFRGRGREKHKFSQRRNHDHFKEERKEGEIPHKSYNKNNFKKTSYDTSKLRCYECKNLGHIAPKCPLRTNTNERSNLVEEDLEPTLLMAILEVEEKEVLLSEEDVGYKETDIDGLWYLDNRASNHMNGVREHFKKLDEEYKKSIENELRTTLKMLRTNQGGAFTSNEFMQYCKENGIARQLTAPYSQQQNRVVERRNRTIMSTTRCMMKPTSMLQNFWAEAVRHAIYILNSVPTKALEDITPYEAIKQRKLNLETLKVFGCIAYAKVPSQHLTKLDDRSIKMNETWDWKDYMIEHTDDEPEWTDFIIENPEVTNEHHDHEIQPTKEHNEFPNNDDDDYASPRNSPTHSQTHHTHLT